ncbi:cysteine desulfurase [Desulfohalobiaceae bacterium Ax17]|uniref:cysteine desulfurase family protein n=1 Tax=Desulfovulcanus ferrireducens TaxID=2831190 RepID=UPI00207BB935|nr:cysteine desulfurase family protein [Desulfovulcanus ferrireducens]MBT8762388.1 cysteine desulfurase [Desulfovulcanus ferrireducens]
MRPLYFDYNATTPTHPQVMEAMLPYFNEHFGNPGCTHSYGLSAQKAMQKARQQVADLINASFEEIIFTSGATESNNLVLQGLLEPGDELIVSAIEHPAILNPARALVRKGIDLKIIPVDHNGLIKLDVLKESCTEKTKLISIMLANNEVGTIQPLKEITSWAREKNILVHTDAAQATGKIPVDVQDLGADFLTIAGHKFYAPKGVGALFIRKEINLKPILYGGGQEKGLRPGTENIPYLVALGQACALAQNDLDQEIKRQKELGEIFLSGLKNLDIDFILHGQNAPRLPNTMSIGFKNLRAGDVISGLISYEVAVSAGAACHSSGEKELSYVLKAMNVNEDYGQGTIRFSWGRMTTKEDVHELLSRLKIVFKSLA